jgi:RHS repeat-associated protein
MSSTTKMKYKILLRATLVLSLLLFLVYHKSYGQLGISGSTTVIQGNSYNYNGTYNGSQSFACNSCSWTYTITNGFVTGFPTQHSKSGTTPPSGGVVGAAAVSVTWSANPGSLNLVMGGAAAGNKTITITVVAPLNPGTLSPSSQTKNYGDSAVITGNKASGGAVSPIYQYQWMSSSDNVNWTNIPGAIDTNYTAHNLTATTYFRRQVTETTTSTIGYTSSVTVIVYPQLICTISPSSQTIDNGATAVTLVSTTTGGNGTYTYQWQTSPDNSTWTNGVTTANYSPGTVTQTKYCRLIVTSNGAKDTSNTAIITINRALGRGIADPLLIDRIPIVQNTLHTLQYTSDANSYSHSIKNILGLRINEDTSLYIPGDFTATVVCQVEYDHTSAFANKIDSIKLTVSYTKNGGNKYNAINYFTFNSAEYSRIKVIRIDAPTVVGGVNFDAKQVLILTNTLAATRYYTMADNKKPTWNSSTATGDALNVSWTIPANTNNNTTQLEWAWLEDEMKSAYTTGSVFDTSLLLKTNSTRIELAAAVTSYSIPLLYGGVGKLYIHVRGSNVMPSGSRSDGPWSGVQAYSFNGHNDSLNWQQTTTYAEEGKRKTVIQYYDGSLRARQTVTKDNSTNTTVVAETFYDAQGRAAVQILPAPGINNIIAYTKNLNKFNSQPDNKSPLDFFDFTTSQLGKYSTARMDTTRGTNLYYSSANSEKNNTSYNKNIPAGNGFAYAVTRYTPDATGRIMMQSGVGDSLNMGGSHTTRYYYGTAGQEELDALFGTEVGYYTHYFKNMVQDANGQMSVSYVDMHGRTIATALAGQSPSSVQALNITDTTLYKNQAGKVMTRNLLDSTTNVLKGNSMESINTILVPFSTLYTFNYNLHKQWLSLPKCTGGTIADTCRFNLQIVISDESDSTVYTYNSTPGIDTLNLQIPVTLSPGSYRVRKTLTINQDSLTKFIQKYDTTDVGICVAMQLQHLTDSLVLADSLASGCAVTSPTLTCKTCLDSLGTYASYLVKYATSLGTDTAHLTSVQKADIRNQYLSDSSFCIAINTNTSHTLESIKQQMLSDMVPYSGQYAVETGSGTMFNKYSIFSTVGGQAYTQPFYKNPRNSSMTIDNYYDAFGRIDSSVTLAKLSSMTKSDFEQAFTDSWTNSLLPYHPEFKRLQYAQSTMQSSFNFIDSINQTSMLAFAPIASDPFFTTISTGTDKTTIKRYSDTVWQNNMSFWQISYGDAFGCKTIIDSISRNTCYSQMPKTYTTTGTVVNTGSGNVTLSAVIQAQAWTMYRGFYTGTRADMVNQWICRHADTTDNYHANIRVNDTLVTQGYKLYFPFNNVQEASQNGWTSWYPNNSGIYPTVNLKDSLKVYSNHCDGYITTWRKTLLQCPALASRFGSDTATLNRIVALITARMDSVCKYGTDGANPFGSSNVAPAYSGNTWTSFEQVITTELDSLGIAKDQFCNPYVIEYPKPYGKNPVISKQYVSGVDTCTCSRFAQLQNEIIAGGGHTNNLDSINRYLRAHYQDTISTVLYQGLSQCSGLPYTPYFYNCHIGPDTCGTDKQGNPYLCRHCDTLYTLPLLSPQVLPVYLTCGFNDSSYTCYSCSAFTAYETSFNSLFGRHPVFNVTDITVDSTLAWNNLFAQYVNYKTGLQHTWEYYSSQFNSSHCSVGGITGTQTALSICLTSTPLNDTTGLMPPVSPCQQVRARAEVKAALIYAANEQQLVANFNAQYLAKCRAAIESFKVTDTVKEYHYTLYYYDQAGNLIKTVPPKGVNPIYRQTWIDSVDKIYRPAGNLLVPAHSYWTRYCYNSLNQVNIQKTPDARVSTFYYDRLGRLTVSQNAKQSALGKVYSYTLYDSLGRITEVGQITGDSTITDALSKNDNRLKNWFTRNTLKRSQITQTVYDTAYGPYTVTPTPLFQQNLRNRVSYTQVTDTASDTYPNNATFYSYDVHGNVDTLLQDFGSANGKHNLMNWIWATGAQSGNRWKKIVYDYDLISGKVNQVSYQRGDSDAYYQRYVYDAENRLTNVYNGRDSVMLFIFQEQEARYFYYKHGPLARNILGQLQVQGLDYAYTLQGWLKGINPTMGGTLTNGTDTTEAKPVAQDVYGFSLNYFNKDYRAISYTPQATSVLGALTTNAAPLYNGNIAAMAVNIPQLSATKLYNYHYDQLNRIVSMDMYNGLNPNAGTFTPASDTSYKERVKYDPNGNILGYLRNGDAGKTMDSLNYKYYSNTNQLSQVSDNVLASKYSTDIDGQSANNYKYDAIGNLISDDSDHITNITWNVYGKIKSVSKTGFQPVTYIYDAAGNRIMKQTQTDTTIYVRDATGNVMSVYTKLAGSSTAINQTEIDLYGSSRLGMATQHIARDTSFDLVTGWGKIKGIIFTRGEKLFELTNHLGNVLVTVTDRRIQGSINNDTVNYYKADIASANDYYPFGMVMPGRTFTASNDYRYGFNGKEKDKNISSLTAYDYGFRIYNPAIGKFLSIDPFVGSYPMLTSYQFSSNSPIAGVDRDGLEFYYSASGVFLGKFGNSQMVFTADKVEEKVETCTDGTSVKWVVSTNSKYLNIDHHKFQVASKIIMKEGLSDDPKEYLDIAHTNYNEANARKNTSMYKLLMSGYSSVKAKDKTALSDKATSTTANAARAGVIDALSGGTDPTGGARRWDGVDYLAKGLEDWDCRPQAKFTQFATVKIPSEIYKTFLKSITDKFGMTVRFSHEQINPTTGTKEKVSVMFYLPAQVFTDPKNFDDNGNFSYSYPKSKGKQTLTATATAGQTIFWRIDKQ